jgi:hypothetical protein
MVRGAFAFGIMVGRSFLFDAGVVGGCIGTPIGSS